MLNLKLIDLLSYFKDKLTPIHSGGSDLRYKNDEETHSDKSKITILYRRKKQGKFIHSKDQSLRTFISLTKYLLL